MVSDFFYPNVGGVENHLFHLSQCLISKGHCVILLTHGYGDRIGIRLLFGELKVYYISIPEMYQSSSFPMIFASLPIIKSIIEKNKINLVHGHQAFSPLCHEAFLHARTMGIPCVFTDHSLFGFDDINSILMNKLLKFTLSDINRIICVSYTSKENIVLRASLDPNNIYVIPNAIKAEQFLPEINTQSNQKISIIVLSRLVYRKGIDLLKHVIPEICYNFPKVRFLIGGDGPKRIDLEQMREQYMLQDKVTLLGTIKTTDVSKVLNSGDIFLNTSLTEAFCMAIVEAACCGLDIVSTNVGGIPEVLPNGMISLSDPDEIGTYL